MVIVQLSIVFWVNVYQNWVDLVRMNFSSNSQARRHAQIAHVVSHPRHTMMKHRKEITCCIAVKASEKSPRERWRQFVLIIVPRCSQHRNYDSFFQNCTCQIQHPNHPTIKFCRFHIQHLLFINGTITEKPMGRTCSAMSFPTTEPQPHFFCPRKGDPKYSLEDIYIYIYNLVIWQFAMENPPIFNG